MIQLNYKNKAICGAMLELKARTQSITKCINDNVHKHYGNSKENNLM